MNWRGGKGTGGKGRGAEGEESCMEGNGEKLERSTRGWELVGMSVIRVGKVAGGILIGKVASK